MQRRRPAQSGPCQEGALRIDIGRRNPCTAARPGDGEPSSEGCLSSAALHCATFMTRPTMRPLLQKCAPSRRPASVSS